MTSSALYDLAPTVVQHAATAAYGLRQRWIRERGVFRETRAMLARSERAGHDELAALQVRELRRLVAHAVRCTRYWPSRLRELGIDPDSIRRPEDLARLPLLDKSVLLERGEDLHARGVGRVRIYHTSGTSGTTLAVPIDDASRQRNYAFFARALSWAGVEHLRSATFAGRPVVPSRAAHPRTVWRWNPFMRNRLFSSYHLSEDNAAAFSRGLCSWAPDYIDSYPSAVSSLAQLLREARLPAPQLKAVITSSETLLPSQREVIREVFGAECFDQYGCTEQGVYISQCEQGSYHAHPEYGIVEIVGGDGRAVGAGEMGEIVCTSFTNAALPLLRYRMGDMARAGEAACGCGRAFPVIREIVGRMDDLLVTPDGRRVGRLDPVFKGRRTIREAKIVQETALDVRVTLVPAAGYTDADGDSVRHELLARLGPEMKIVVERVAEIPRTSAGKFRAVENLWARRNAARAAEQPREPAAG